VWFGAAASMCLVPWRRNDNDDGGEEALGGGRRRRHTNHNNHHHTNNGLELTTLPVTLPAAGPVVIGAAGNRRAGDHNMPLTTVRTTEQQQPDGTWVQVTTQVTETPTPAGPHTVTVVNSVPLAAAAAASYPTPIATAIPIPIIGEGEYAKKG
jgi:hypothetical protein